VIPTLRSMRRSPRFGVALAVALLAMNLGMLPARAGSEEAAAPDRGKSAAPSNAEKPAPVQDFSKPMGPPDPLNRGTPRGSMYGFLNNARKGKYEDAARFLDLRRLPLQENELGADYARRLKTVLDQQLWIDLINLADTNAGLQDDDLPDWQDRLGEIQTRDGQVTLLMQRVPREGDGVRIWKVAASTVARVPALYAEFQPAWIEAWLPDAVVGRELFGEALWKWVGMVVLLGLASFVSLLIAGTTTRVLAAILIRRNQSIDPRFVHHFRGPVRLAWTVALFAAGAPLLGPGLALSESLRTLERLFLVVAAAWLVLRVIDLASLVARVRAEREERSGLLPVLIPGARLTKVLIVIFAFLGVLGSLGVNVSAAVAGLGVGGLAIALAAQKSLENLLGGINLFADQPVQVGNFCRYGDQVGTVEEIGLRSTRIRSLDRTVVTIPNSEFSNLKLENYALRDRMRLWTMVGVRYETTPDQLRYVLVRLREILIAHPRVTDDPARVRFVGFGAYSLDLEVFAYVDTADWNEFLGIREDLYLRFMDAIKEAGTGFAFPSSTTYIGRDDGLREEEVRRAETRVAEWREKGELPLPNLSPDARQGIENTLEWPPPGSPERPKA
jgi:MscS family membrane protein